VTTTIISLQGGVYIFQLMDFYAASGMSLLWCVFFQTAAICWCFGAKTVYECIEQMIGFKITKVWYYCWMYIAPAFMVVRKTEHRISLVQEQI
jgi:SNF family Na+-dependent transporter